MNNLNRKNLRKLLLDIINEDYGPMQDPAVLFPGQQEELRAMNDELESKKAGTYAAFVDYLRQNVNDPKMQALLNSGHFDGSMDDDAVIVQEIDIPVSQLQPTQSEIGLANSIEWTAENAPDKGALLAAASPGSVADVGGRIITADGKYIVDGHHRWSQVYILNPTAKIPAYNLVTRDSSVPGAQTTNTGQDYLKMSQLAIAAVDGVVPQVAADTATDIYRTGGDKNVIENMMKNLVPRGSKFAMALEDQLMNKGDAQTSGEKLTDQASEDLMQTAEISGELEPNAGGPDVETDAQGKAVQAASSGDQEVDDKVALNEIFSRTWVTLSEQTEALLSEQDSGFGEPNYRAMGYGMSGNYQAVIDKLVNNAVQLYNGTAEEAAKMTPRSEMPQYDKGGSEPQAKIDALTSGHIDWNAPYDQSDLESTAQGADREDIKINENRIRQMIRNSIRRSLNS